MKRISIFMGILSGFISFAQTGKNYATISGKIDASEKILKLAQFGTIIKDLKVNEDGTFKDTIRLKNSNYFTLNTLSKKSFPIYVQKGTNLVLNIGKENDDVKISGSKDSKNTKFLIFKNKFFTEKIFKKQTELFSENPQNFKNIISKLFTELREELNKFQVSKNFAELETKSIDFETIGILENYPRAYSYITKKKAPELPADFFKEKENINYENGFWFENIQSYRNLVLTHFIDTIEEKLNKNQDITSEIQKINTIKPKNIKEELAQIFSQFISFNTEKNNKILHRFVLQNTKNQKLIDQVNKNIEAIKRLAKGSIAPSFNLESEKGEKISLEALRGKPVYIDVWATWCGPCRREIPFLKNLEKELHEKIHFVSISIDEAKDKNKWLNFIKKEKLGGIQLMAENGFRSQITENYAIKSIPRFILIDKDGKILSANASRPSDENTLKLLKSLVE